MRARSACALLGGLALACTSPAAPGDAAPLPDDGGLDAPHDAAPARRDARVVPPDASCELADPDWGCIEPLDGCRAFADSYFALWDALECTRELGHGPSTYCGERDEDGCRDPGELDRCWPPEDGGLADACTPEPFCDECSGADLARCRSLLAERASCSELEGFGCIVRCRLAP